MRGRWRPLFDSTRQLQSALPHCSNVGKQVSLVSICSRSSCKIWTVPRLDTRHFSTGFVRHVARSDCSRTGGEDSPGHTPTSTEHTASSQGVELLVCRGLPQLVVPLPSRRERCRFTLRPVGGTVSDLIDQLSAEDRGIDRVVFKTPDGVRIATSDSIGALMESDFNITINDDTYHVKTPQQQRLTADEIATLSNVRNMVSQLYEALNIEEHQLKKEREILAQMEELRIQLEPMEKIREQLETSCRRRTSALTWTALGLMGVQFGVLARLTWWEYSWDIMEPVTYFVTYGTAMAAYAYFAVTKQDYVLPDVRDRAYLLNFYKRSRRNGLDVRKYNELRDNLHCLELDLKRLRDPLQIHLPPKHLDKPVDTQFSLNSLMSLLKSGKYKLSGDESDRESPMHRKQPPV